MKDIKKIEIDIIVDQNTPIYNKFNSNQLSDELSDYIYNQCKGLPTNSNITLKIISSFKITNEEKDKIVDCIRQNYGICIKENLIKLRFEHAKELLMLVTGIFLLIISSLFNSFISSIIGEIISIFGCVVIWEIAYNIFFIETEIRIKNKRFRKLTEAKIEFI